jgi:hypothetical protein
MLVSDPKMVVRLKMEPSDHQAWSSFIRRDGQSFAQRNFGALQLVCTIALMLTLQQLLLLAGTPLGISIILGISVALFVAGQVSITIRRRLTTNMFDPDGAYLRPAELEISEQGLRIHNEIGDCIYYWKAFKRLEQDHKHTYLFIDKMNAVIIPDRNFDSENQMREFIEYVRPKIKTNTVRK